MAVNKGVDFEIGLGIEKACLFVRERETERWAREESQDCIKTKYRLTGEIIMNNDKKNWSNLVKNEGDKEWTVGGRPAAALFMQGASTSQMFEAVKNEVKNGIVFKRQPDGQWKFSLYNTKDEYDAEFHCGQYLKDNYHGGGHAGAAGATLSEEEFLEALKTKKL